MKNLLIVFLLLISVKVSAEYLFQNGVFPEIKYDRKGHFYLTKHKDRYLFVTPEGEGFYPLGINHLNNAFAKDGLPNTNGEAKQSVIKNIKEWGFNSAGYGVSRQLINEGVYFIGSLNIVKHGFYHLDEVTFPDVFEQAFESKVEEVMKRVSKQIYKPKQLIGMVWSDLPAWNIFKSRMLRQTDWVTEIRNQNCSTAGKKAYVSFLKKKYENKIDDLKKYYRMTDDNIKNLETYDFSGLYLGHPVIMKDDELFMAMIADRYYKLGSKYHHKYFTNIPLLGDRFLIGDHPDEVLKVASRYVDAISVQVGDGYGETMLPSYPFPKKIFDHIHEITNKSILLADHQISFCTHGYKHTTFSQAGDEKVTARETEKFLKASFSDKHVIGYFRCSYMTKEENHGRGVKQGFIDFHHKPYESITEAYTNSNLDISKYID